MHNQEFIRLRRLVPSIVFAITLFFFMAVMAQAGPDRSHGLLWEISTDGALPSYLFGTIHSEDPGVLKLAGEVQRAFDSSDSVILEVKLDMDAMVYSSSAMLMTDGRLLSEITGRALFEKTAKAISTRGIPEVVLERMKPWAAAITLSIPAPETGMVLDMKLFQAAQQSGKQVYGLETLQEQLGVFESMSERDQITLLKDAVDNFHLIDRMNAELVSAWKQRDLARMQAISDEAMQQGNQRLAQDFEKRLIVDRNRLMAERAEQYLEKGKAFIAVGALHLPGEEGLLNLLEQQGYSVRAIY